MEAPLSDDTNNHIQAILQALRDFSRALLNQIESTTDKGLQTTLYDRIRDASHLSDEILKIQLANDDAVLNGQLPQINAGAKDLKSETAQLKTAIADAAIFAQILGFATQIALLVAAL